MSLLREKYAVLLDPAAPLDERIRALYRLKEDDRSVEGAALLLEAVDATDSVLLQHELVYNVGQFGFCESIPALERVATASQYDTVTRHEAIEALGAVGDVDSLPFLRGLLGAEGDDGVEGDPIHESVVLAICRIEMKQRDGSQALAPPSTCPFVSVDPSPAFAEERSVGELERLLNDASASLWDRYRAMFSLRNVGSEAAVLALGKALRSDTRSCLFRHEVAFVLGQLEHASSEPYLSAALSDDREHPMVRHEAAEALGALAEKHSWDLLEKFSHDREGIVKDSCVVALEMFRYWSQFKQ